MSINNLFIHLPTVGTATRYANTVAVCVKSRMNRLYKLVLTEMSRLIEGVTSRHFVN